MIPLTTLYDEYIDRPKLSEQKKLFECIVPSPLKWVGTKTESFKKIIQSTVSAYRRRQRIAAEAIAL